MLFLQSISANRTKCSTYKKLLWTFFLMTLSWPHSGAHKLLQLPHVNLVYYDVHDAGGESSSVLDPVMIDTTVNVSSFHDEKRILKIIGVNFPNDDDIIVKITDSDTNCENTSSKPLDIIFRNETVMLANDDSDLYFGRKSASYFYLCFYANDNFVHMGMKSKFMRQQR